MNIPLTSADFAHLGASLSHATPLSMLDGYLAAVASGPNFILPEQVLQWLWNAGIDNDIAVASMVVQYYLSVNDALNDQVYVPRTTSMQAWCRGYLAGFANDMIAWAPLLAAQPDFLKMILSGAEDRPFGGDQNALAVAARRIHAFWVERRRLGLGSNGILGPLGMLSPRQAVLPNLLH